MPVPRVTSSAPHFPPPSPALAAHFAVSVDFDAGERGELGWDFYPGRRAEALALGYIPSPFQG